MFTKGHFINALILFALTIVILFSNSCQKNEEESTEEPSTKIPETTKILSEEEWESIIIEVDHSDYTFTFTSNPGLEVGDILVTSSNGGYIRKVSEITEGKGHVIIKTVFSTLAEAVENGKFELTKKTMSVNQTHDSSSLTQEQGVDILGTTDATLLLSLDYVVHDIDGDDETKEDQVKLEGQLEIKTGFGCTIIIENHDISYLNFAYDLKDSAGLTALVGNQIGILEDKEKKLGTIVCKKFFIPNPIPLIIEPYIDLFVGMSADANFKLQSSVSQVYKYEAELIYDGDWSHNIKENGNEFSAEPLSLNGSLEAKMYVKPQIRFKINRVISEYINCEFYEKVSTEIEPNIIKWFISFGLDIKSGVKAKIFSYNLFNVDVDLFDQEWPVNSGQIGAHTEIPCPGIPTVDYGDQTYNTVLIGEQCWLKENLNIGKKISSNSPMTDNDTIEKYCYGNNPENCNRYGGLYTWDEVMNYSSYTGGDICPDGWHVPSDEEWKTLEGQVDTYYDVGDPEWNGEMWRGQDVGNLIKSDTGWSSNGNGEDMYGFSALPGGRYVSDNSEFDFIKTGGFWWASNSTGLSAWDRHLKNNKDGSHRYYTGNKSGLSVRCIKD